ncbi:thioredoxin family protein [Candidatus Micrarchaeota archaeon]|nr:thioredoxin family protein [Candidatus Micrarchaeota archaeon]
MIIEVVGSGCRKCMELEKRAKEAAIKSGIKADVVHVFDVSRIIEMGIVSTPAILINGKVALSGSLPNVDELIVLFREKAN